MSSRPTANPSGGLTTGTTLVFNGKCTLNSIQLLSDGTNACSCNVYDNIVGSGKLLAVLALPASTVAPSSIVYNNALKAEIGITIIVSGTGATAFLSTGGA